MKGATESGDHSKILDIVSDSFSMKFHQDGNGMQVVVGLQNFSVIENINKGTSCLFSRISRILPFSSKKIRLKYDKIVRPRN